MDEDVKDCISRAANSIGLKEMPNYKVEKQDQTDWIKLTQVIKYATLMLHAFEATYRLRIELS